MYFFFENYPPVLEILRKNILNLKYGNKSKIINIDAFKITRNNFKINQKFEIIFCDPPYKEKKIELLIENIFQMNILEKDGYQRKKNRSKASLKHNMKLWRNVFIILLLIKE